MRWEGFGQDKVGKTVIESFNEQMFQLKARYVPRKKVTKAKLFGKQRRCAR